MSDEAAVDPLAAIGPLLVVITGPSAVGKDTVLDRLKVIVPSCFVAVTATTRPRREGERHGVDYVFVTRDEYDRMVAEGEFLEHATVYGKGYGTPLRPVREALGSGRDAILRIDVQGAATIASLVPGSIRIFLAPPSFAELERRLRERKSDAPDVIERRLITAREELLRAAECDYLVINADGRLDEAVCEIEAIMRAERRRVRRDRVVV